MCNRRPSIHSRLVLKRSSKSPNLYHSSPLHECLDSSDGGHQELVKPFRFARDPNGHPSEAGGRVAGLADRKMSDPDDSVRAAEAYLRVPTGVLVPEDSGHRVLKLPSIDYLVDHSMISHEFCALKALGEFLPDRFLNDPGPCETNQSPRLCQSDSF